jgi:hypothetical protein
MISYLNTEGCLKINKKSKILREVAWGERFDAFGNKWWLIEMSANNEFRENFHQIG